MRLTVSMTVLCAIVALFLMLHGPSTTMAEDWGERLASSDVDSVLSALDALAKSRDASAARAVIGLATRTRHAHVAEACGRSLAAIADADVLRALGGEAPASKMLKKLSQSKHRLVRRNIVRLLGTWRPRMSDALLAAVVSRSRDVDLTIEAVHMCGSIDPTQNAAFPKTGAAIAKALKHRDGLVRSAACMAAGRRQLEDLRPALMDLVRRSTQPLTGLYAVTGLGMLPGTTAISEFASTARKTRDDNIRRACLKAVVELASLNDFDVLLKLTRNADAQLRDAACLALTRLVHRGSPRAEGSEGKDRKPDSRSVGSLLESQLGEMAKHLVAAVGSEKNWAVRDSIRLALLALGQHAAAAAEVVLPRLVRASDVDVAIVSMNLCGELGLASAHADLLAVARQDGSPVRRMFAARALGELDATRAVRELTQGLRSKKRARARDLRCIEALGYINADPALQRLLVLLDMPGLGGSAYTAIQVALERLTARRFGPRSEDWAVWLRNARQPLAPRAGSFDREGRRRAVRESGLYGVTPATERAVAGGLRWLENDQHPLGYWAGVRTECEVAYTGLTVLAFLGAGHRRGAGTFGETLRRSGEYLAAAQLYHGGFARHRDAAANGYISGMGTWALVEALAMDESAPWRARAQRGVDYLTRVQKPGSGWRYEEREERSDTSCTAWCLSTMRIAELVGLRVEPRVWDGADAWLRACTTGVGGEVEAVSDLASDYDYEVGSLRLFKVQVSYREARGSPTYGVGESSMTAAGMVCRYFMGWRRSHPHMIGSANLLGSDPPEADAWREGRHRLAHLYRWYYATLGLHQMGGRYWRAWCAKLRLAYINGQTTEPQELSGSWDKPGRGRLYATAFAVLTLETFYRYSPLLQSEAEVTVGDKGK